MDRVNYKRGLMEDATKKKKQKKSDETIKRTGGCEIFFFLAEVSKTPAMQRG